MSILGRILRCLHVYGYPTLSGDPISGLLGGSKRRKRARGWERARYLESMEPRVLMTTIIGGTKIQYTDAHGKLIMAQANGNLIAELVTAVQSGDGSLVFGHLKGKLWTSGANINNVIPTLVGNGAVPTTYNIGGTDIKGSSALRINDPDFGALRNGTGNDQTNVQALAVDNTGTTFAFNEYNIDDQGKPLIDPVTSANIWHLQLVIANTTTGAQIDFVDLTNIDVGLPEFAEAKGLRVGGAAFNPLDGKLYFDVGYTVTPMGGVDTNTDTLYMYDPVTKATTSLGALDATEVDTYITTGLAFHATSSSTADMWITQELRAGNNNNNNTTRPQISQFPAAANGTFTIDAASKTSYSLTQGFFPDVDAAMDAARITNVFGLTSVSNTDGGDFLYAMVNGGANNGGGGGGVNASGNSHIIRINLTPMADLGDGTANRKDTVTNLEMLDAVNWGDTLDLQQVPRPTGTAGANAKGPFDGNNLVGIGFDPLDKNPFTGGSGGSGVFVSIDLSTGDLVFCNPDLRLAQADVYAAYVSQSNISASLTFAGPTLYQGIFGALNTPNPVTLPADAGVGYLGFTGLMPNYRNLAAAFSANNPFITGVTTQNIGVVPAFDTTHLTNATANQLGAGLTVANTLESFLQPTAGVLAQVLTGYNHIIGMSVKHDGTMAVLNAGGAGDSIAFVDPLTGLLNTAGPAVTFGGAALKNGQAFAYGAPALDGNEQLYAIYNLPTPTGLPDGNGPTLGTIDAATGVFTPVTVLGLGKNARVSSMAFTLGGTALDATHQGLYITADVNAADGDGAQYLYQVANAGAAYGAVVNGPTLNGDNDATAPNGVQILDTIGNNVLPGSAVFNANGDLVVLDRLTGRLMDVSLAAATLGVAGSVIATGKGTLNPTVGAIAYDPVQQKYFAADNVTGAATVPGNANGAVLMSIKDFTQTGASAQNLGKFFFDGTVTGEVDLSGSIEQFYAGLILTGNVSGGDFTDATTGDVTRGGWLLPRSQLVAGVDYADFPDNFHAAGDIRNLLSQSSIGVGADANASAAKYKPNLQITADGKIGNVHSGGSVAGFIHAGNKSNIPNLVDDGSPGSPQQEIRYFTNTYPYASGYLTNPIFNDTSFANSQYLGTIKSATLGSPDVIDLQGILQTTRVQGVIPNPVDYYGIALLAGQTVDIAVTDLSGSGELQVGIFDPDQRLIMTDYNDLDITQTQGKTLRFTADRPGVYRIALAINGNVDFVNTYDVSFTAINYSLQVSGVNGGLGNMGIGSVRANNQVVLLGQAQADLSIPAIWSDVGDIGVIQGTTAVESPAGFSGLDFVTRKTGYQLISTPSEDIKAPAGNLRVLTGGYIGIWGLNATAPNQTMPDISVSGTVGLIQATATGANAYTRPILTVSLGNAAGGSIQTVNAAGSLAGYFRANMGFGNILAGSIPFGSTYTEFHANVDNKFADGTIDLIDVGGDIGGSSSGVLEDGPAIETGPGGNVRFMRASGQVLQDIWFGTGDIGSGEITHDPGDVTFIDDSGSQILLRPGPVTIPDPNNTGQTITGAGVLRTLSFGIRDGGGAVLMRVTSNSGLTVQVTANGLSHSGEITQITTGGAGIPLVINATTGIPSNGTIVAGATGGTITNDVTISASNPSTRVDVFTITNGNGGTINTIRNTAVGDILNMAAGDVGVIQTNGNLGSMFTSSGNPIIPLTVFSNAFPFVNQHFGISVANVGSISATKAIGNILASGVIGTVTANSDNAHDPNDSVHKYFEGINGPILINGTAPTTLPIPGTTVIRPVSITTLNIGEGILYSGNGAGSRAGLYAVGRIGAVIGRDADIRGNIVTQDTIGTVSLTNGSIITAKIESVDTFNQSSELFFPSGGGYTTPGFAPNIDKPVPNIGSITITGNGGVIGSEFIAADMTGISVDPALGFGIFNSRILSSPNGVVGNLTAGGYGIRNVTIRNSGRVGNITATGNGTPAALTKFSTSVRQSTFGVTNDPNYGFAPNILSDLAISINGDSSGVNLPDPQGTTTGVIETLYAAGNDRIGTITAYNFVTSIVSFAQSAGSVNIGNDITNVDFTAGGLKGLTVGHDATDLDFEIAGHIGPITIKGNFLDNGGATNGVSRIVAKGPTGAIDSATVNGNFSGTLISEGTIGGITIGTKGVGTAAGTGDFSGHIAVGGNGITGNVLNNLKVFGSVSGGTVDITGNVGTIDIGSELSGLSSDLVVRGNLVNLLIGTDTFVNGSDVGAPLTITGSLTKGVVTGKITSTVTVVGGIGTFNVNSDAVTAGTDVLSGALLVGGTLGTLVVQGSASGEIAAVGTISSATITGTLLDGGAVISSLGDIKSLIINGSLNGMVSTPFGKIVTLSTGTSSGMGVNALLAGRSAGTITIPGKAEGTIDIDTVATSIKAGSFAATANITAGSIPTLTTTTGDFLGNLTLLNNGANSTLTVKANWGGTTTLAGPITATVNGDVLASLKLISASSLTSLTVKGALHGQLLVDRGIGTISAASMGNAVVTAGLGINSITLKGAMTNSLVQAGLARGVDGVFGTDDLGEQAVMADIKTLTVGSVTNSIVAAGGNVGTFKSTGVMTGSSASSGLVLDGAQIAAVQADATPLALPADLNTARTGVTLLHGSVSSATVGSGTANTMVSSALTAGVSPGADGDFATAADNTVATSLSGGVSKFTTAKANLDAGSRMLANASGNGITAVKYTLDNNAVTSITPGNPVPTTAPTAVATPGHDVTVGGLTIKVTGPADAKVSLWDNATTADRLDTMVISSTTSTAISVTVVNGTGGTFQLGRVLATDGTNVGSFAFDGDILGDLSGGPALWIDSDMTKFSVRNTPNDPTWFGAIGGNVSTLTVDQLGPGSLRVGGKVTTLNVSSSVGNPLLKQLGTVTPPTAITQLAYNTGDGSVFATDGLNLLGVDVNTGAVNTNIPVTSPLGGPLSLDALTFMNANGSHTLMGVATLNNQLPTDKRPNPISAGDQLHALAVNSIGTVYAIDTDLVTGLDKLVTLDPVSGKETVVGVLRNISGYNYQGGVLALAFDAQDNLLALFKDRDGTGPTFAPADGVALGRIDTTANGGFVQVSNYYLNTTNNLNQIGGYLPAVLNNGAPVVGNFTALTVDNGVIFAVQHVGATDEFDQLTLSTSNTPTATTAIAAVGNVKLGAADTQILGMGVDEHGNLIALENIAGKSDLLKIDTTTPANSTRVTVSAALATNFAGFAMGKSGAAFTSYGYTTDAASGGQLYVSTGVGATLGNIDPVTGGFVELLPLQQDTQGTALAGVVQSIAIDSNGSIFAITDLGELVKYASDGSFDSDIGQVIDVATGAPLDITRIGFDGDGNLIGLNAHENRLVRIGTTTGTSVNGFSGAIATGLTELGTADATDLTSLAFSTADGRFLSYSNALGAFVEILGTTPGALGGLTANAIGTANLPSSFAGRLAATGMMSGVTFSGIDNIKFTGIGTYKGNISSTGAIGTVSVSGAGNSTAFDGAIVSHGDFNSVTVANGNALDSGIFAADGNFKNFSFTGDSFGGAFLAGQAGTVTFTLSGTVLTTAQMIVINDTNSFTVSSKTMHGQLVLAGNVKTLKLTGQLLSDSSVFVGGDAGAVALGGALSGSAFVMEQGVTSLTLGGLFDGVISSRRSAGTVTVATADHGVVAIGGDITTLNVTGSVNSSVFASGVWVGDDGIYNTADDVIFGGSIKTGTFSGVFTDSIVAAGVLPRQGAPSSVNNIPSDANAFVGFLAATDIADVNPVEAGGLSPSIISKLTFAKPVVSTSQSTGLFSAAVAADALGTIGSLQNTSNLTRKVFNDPIGAPEIVQQFSDSLLADVPARFLTPSDIQILFSENIDSATLNADTITVDVGGTPITDLSFTYSVIVASDGSVQGVLTIHSTSNYNNAQANLLNVNITLVGEKIMDRSGPRSALGNFEDPRGVLDMTTDPYGTTLAGGTQTIAAIPNA